MQSNFIICNVFWVFRANLIMTTLLQMVSEVSDLQLFSPC